MLEIEASQLRAIEQHDLTLVVADEAENAEIMQPRQRARYRLQRQPEIVPVGNLIRLASEAESRNVSIL